VGGNQRELLACLGHKNGGLLPYQITEIPVFLVCPLAMPAGCDLGCDTSSSEISSAVNQSNDAAESQAAVRHLKICSRCGRLEQES